MSESPQRKLTTEEVIVEPGQRATLATPVSPVRFSIESMMAKDSELRFVALRAEMAPDAKRPGLFARAWQWWTGNAEESDPVRLIYDAEAPKEDPNEDAGPQEFEDFLLSLLALHGVGKHYDVDSDGMTPFDATDDEERGSAADVQPGERLLLNVFNPTADPITVRVTFAGPEL